MGAVQKRSKTQLGGIILCGGRSSRMGSDKANLQIGAQTFLARIAGVVGQCVDHIVLVAAQDQSLPDLPAQNLTVVRDLTPFEGPLSAFIAGMEALPHNIDRAFVTSCDLPLMDVALIRALIAQSEEGHSSKWQIVVPIFQGHPQVLCAVYDRRLAEVARKLLRNGSRRMRDLLDQDSVCRLDEQQLIQLGSSENALCSVNTPEEYQRVLTMFKHFHSSD